MKLTTPDTFAQNTNPTVDQTRNMLSSICNLVLVVDRSKARFFSTSPFHIEETIQNSLGREKNRTMTTDRINRDEDTDPHEDAAIQFARELSHRVQRKLNDDHQLTMLIVCEARFQGYLHRFIDDARIQWHKGDLGYFSETDILKYLVDKRESLDVATLRH